MFRSSRDFARRIISGSNSGSKLPTKKNAALHKSLTLLVAAAGTAGCYGIATNVNDGKARSFFERLAPLGAMTNINTNTNTTTTHCDGSHQDFAARHAKLKRKKTVLKVAASLQRLNTNDQISRLRIMQEEMLTRWERDEDGWRNLPSRAWPEYQPNPQQVETIVAEIARLGCTEKIMSKKEGHGAKLLDNNINTRIVRRRTSCLVRRRTSCLVRRRTSCLVRRRTSCSFTQCKKLHFDMASGLVFYQVDPDAGFALFESLAKRGHTDSMVACGIVLLEGLGVPPREKEGLAWLEKAMESHQGNDDNEAAAQASYELGTVYYTGIDGIVEEDPERAFALFQFAAKQNHTAALYMVADCLVEGEGTERNVHEAVPLFYKAAERGHRYSRQRIRELLAHGGYPL
jgi:hypothetical protein